MSMLVLEEEVLKIFVSEVKLLTINIRLKLLISHSTSSAFTCLLQVKKEGEALSAQLKLT